MTPARKAALEWFKKHEPAAWFPNDGPTPSMRKMMERAGEIERVPVPADFVGMTQWRLTAAGKAALG